MKYKIIKYIVFISLILSLPVFGYTKTITIVADEWPPFNNADDSESKGYMIDVAKEIFESKGFNFVYKNLPWKRAIAETRKGFYTGVVGASKTDAKGFIFPSEELARNYLSFYVQKGTAWKFEQQTSISSVTIATIAGYDYRRWLNEYINKYSNNPAKVQINHGEKPLVKNLKKLMIGRVDVVVDNEAAIRYVANQMGILNEIKSAGYGTQASYIYIAFSPEIPESKKYAQILSDGIISMRNNGRLSEILNSYGLLDWKKQTIIK